MANATPATLGASFGYLISVAPPASGFGAAPAVPSTITLRGGAHASGGAATAATATVISS